VNRPPLHRELRQALSLWLLDVGDLLDRGEVESARVALRMAVAIDGELSFGPRIQPIDVESSNDGMRVSDDHG
jgi:hypothetical protein